MFAVKESLDGVAFPSKKVVGDKLLAVGYFELAAVGLAPQPHAFDD